MAHSLNLAWVLLTAFLVMFMQLGFSMVETGFTRSKNAVHTMAMNFVIYPVGIVGFWLVGYGVAFGGVEGWSSLGIGSTDHAELGIRLGSRFFGLNTSLIASTSVANLARLTFAADLRGFISASHNASAA